MSCVAWMLNDSSTFVYGAATKCKPIKQTRHNCNALSVFISYWSSIFGFVMNTQQINHCSSLYPVMQWYGTLQNRCHVGNDAQCDHVIYSCFVDFRSFSGPNGVLES